MFQNLIARGLDPDKVKLVSSDGGLGLPAAMKKCFPIAPFTSAHHPNYKNICSVQHYFVLLPKISIEHCVNIAPKLPCIRELMIGVFNFDPI